MLVSTVLASLWWAQYVTSVKLGFATEGSVLAPMPVPAHSPMQNVWNVSAGSGTMEAEYSAVRFVIIFLVKMISLSIKPAAKF